MASVPLFGSEMLRPKYSYLLKGLKRKEDVSMETGLLTTDQIRSWVIPLLEKYDMCSASLFGSYARDEADASSDIDILLVGNPGFRPLNVFGVAEDLHRLSGKKVDVFELSELDAGPFRDAVLRDAVLL